jgi:hypothetical protein
VDDDALIDWPRALELATPRWSKQGTFSDVDGRDIAVGDKCTLLGAAATYDDRRQRSGTFAIGQMCNVSAISIGDPVLLFIEGLDERGWAFSWVRPSEVRTSG